MNTRFTKKEILSIPNILSYFRILLIPVFVTLFLRADTASDYYLVAAVVMISTVTDMFDGLIARKCNMITELGIFIDPLADKLTHAALVVCLSFRYRIMLLVVAVMIVKEGFMAVMGIINLRKGRKLGGAQWFGKVCTAILFLSCFLLVLFPSIPATAANALILFCACFMLFTMFMYIPVFRRLQ